MKDFAEILKAVAWPITVFAIVIILRFRVGELAGALAKKVMDSNRLKVRWPGGAFELASQVARTSIGPAAKSQAGESDADEFTRLALEYENLKIADLSHRVAERMKLADRLGRLAILLNSSRKTLAGGNEGQLVALATAAVLEPRPRDILTLMTASERVRFKFTGYRIVLAIPVIAKGVLGSTTIDRLEEMLRNVERNAKSSEDEDLQDLIDATRRTLSDLRRQID